MAPKSKSSAVAENLTYPCPVEGCEKVYDKSGSLATHLRSCLKKEQESVSNKQFEVEIA